MLSDGELETLRTGLVRQLASLRGEIKDEVAAEAGEHYRDLAGEVTDLADEAIGAELAGTGNAIIGHHVHEVRNIEGALADIATGRYGCCHDCGVDIEYARLTAYPTCTRCERCQSVHEKTYVGERHPSL